MAMSVWNPGFGPLQLPELLGGGIGAVPGREAAIRDLKMSFAPARGFLARARAKDTEVVLVLGGEFHGVSK